MFDHVTIRASDREASRRFYETVLEPLGHALSHSGGNFDEWSDFGLADAREGRPVTRGLHVALIDHLWIRVAGLEASRRFYETVAPVFGLQTRASERAERLHVAARDRSFALRRGCPRPRRQHRRGSPPPVARR